MITVTKPAQRTFSATCIKCGCEFHYELSDTWRNYVRGCDVVSCPGCGEMCSHWGRR